MFVWRSLISDYLFSDTPRFFGDHKFFVGWDHKALQAFIMRDFSVAIATVMRVANRIELRAKNGEMIHDSGARIRIVFSDSSSEYDCIDRRETSRQPKHRSRRSI